ncbi:CIA30 family protein [Flavobacterium sp. W21_SRS_FM6]|uniref:CIA30 family protein n=1 Tax=Flavobacterium sp. W21_SRS_FM6 TaxID=3240268 RepID=UPI003F8EAEBF
MKRVLLGLLLMLITESAMAKSLLPQLRWYVINDSVMGGQSNSKLSLIEDDIYFTGQLSLANNGGFASIRAQLLLGMGEAQRIAIKVKGEPRTYQFRLRTNDNMDGIAYKVEFETKGSKKWQTFSFSPLDFTASYRGRAVANAPKLQFANVSQLGFLIADKNLAPFSLLIDDIAIN